MCCRRCAPAKSNEQDLFDIGRGTKQGDPLSPILFSSVLESVLAPLQERWRGKGCGVQVDESATGRLCTSRFADDILVAVGPVGLEIHPGKSKVMHNEFARGASTQNKLDVGGFSFEVVPPGSGTDYPGRFLSLGKLHDHELDSRLQKAWEKFHTFKRSYAIETFTLDIAYGSLIL